MTPAPAVVERPVLSPTKAWKPNQLRFMAWLALPEVMREPRGQRAFAEKLGVHEVTICNWKHLPGFGEGVFKLAREVVKSDELSQILHGISRQARAGNIAAAEFVFRALGIMLPVSAGTSIHIGDNVVNADMKVIEVLGTLPPGREE